MTTRDPDVDAILAATPRWMRGTLAKLRRIIHATDPLITEAAKWKKPSNPLGVATFERDGIVCVAIPLKERVRLMFPAGSRLADPKKLFNAQLNGVSRAIDFRETDDVDGPAIRALVRASVAQRTRAKPRAKKAATKARTAKRLPN
ncbi:MAG: DUF1801 domain-containing protein [Thermoplasmatota archaeon]